MPNMAPNIAKPIGRFLFHSVLWFGGLSCIFVWLGVKPQDLWGWRVSLGAYHWAWLALGMLLFAVGMASSGYHLYRSLQTNGSTTKLQTEIQPRLVIHRAIYGAGPKADIDITESLKNKARDGLVISVDNNLVPYDPAPGVRKRLVVEYSYGDGIVYCASRRESMQGDIVRLTLPEDSELHRLTDELKKKPEQIERGKAAAVEPDKPKAAPIHNWNAEWKELTARFEKLPKHNEAQLQTDRMHGQIAKQEWRFSGYAESVQTCEALCGYAGSLLLKSPNISRTLSVEIRNEPNPAWRWLFFLKENFNAVHPGATIASLTDDQGYSVISEVIREIPVVSVRACIDCASRELGEHE